jgi:hypothetical protein
MDWQSVRSHVLPHDHGLQMAWHNSQLYMLQGRTFGSTFYTRAKP